MLHVSPRTHDSANRARPPAIQTTAAWRSSLRALALGGALVLAAGVSCHAAETGASARTKVSSIPVKARPANAAKGDWDLGASARPEAVARPYTAGVAQQHIQSLSVVSQFDCGTESIAPRF